VRRYTPPMRPAILTDATTRWPALRRWTPEFFRERYGSIPVDIDGKTWRLGEYIDAHRTRNGSNRSSIRDIEQPNLKRFPLFAKATPTVFDLRPGETLFVPSGWWHTVKLLSPSITISVNAANRLNWRAFVRDFVESKRTHRSAALCAALYAYLTVFWWGESLLGTMTGWTRFL
jgi:hypothetical protein